MHKGLARQIETVTQSTRNSIAVEHRYIADIVDGIQADGLTVH